MFVIKCGKIDKSILLISPGLGERIKMQERGCQIAGLSFTQRDSAINHLYTELPWFPKKVISRDLGNIMPHKQKKGDWKSRHPFKIIFIRY